MRISIKAQHGQLEIKPPGEQLPYSPGLVPGEEGGGANVNMAGVSLRSRDLAYLRFPGAIRALGLQTTHI